VLGPQFPQFALYLAGVGPAQFYAVGLQPVKQVQNPHLVFRGQVLANELGHLRMDANCPVHVFSPFCTAHNIAYRLYVVKSPIALSQVASKAAGTALMVAAWLSACGLLSLYALALL
jgi:hypothetical protein